MTTHVKAGDLVNFFSTVKSFQSGYVHRNPGIVLERRLPSPTSTSMSWDRGSACVLWSNGEISTEHLSYLQKAV